MKRAATKRRVTRNCQGQQAIPADLVSTDTTPAAEPTVKAPAKKAYRSQRADDWAHATVANPQPCFLCGNPALLRDPYTGRACHMTCAKQDATEKGEQW
ncbi:hypothetical protein ACQPXM_32955 [Kribbella sp. CA-253562]|uniref:hypothetical protein n=1 Tax=Kribbella sp. CA-253562 TaxID=3239942 RepID=UPI003D92E63C